MRVVIAPDAGFCFGVREAVDRVQVALAAGRRVAVLAPIVHNRHVMAKLQEGGLRLANSLRDLGRDELLVVPSHGATLKGLQQARELGIEVLDLTCPRVRRSQAAAERLVKRGLRVLIIGDPNHAEVRSVASRGGATAAVVPDAAAANALPPDGRWGVIAQTTSRRDEVERIIGKIVERSAEVVVETTSCQVCAAMQDTVRGMADTVEAMVVVGGRSSANTANLAAIARSRGVRTYQVEDASELVPAWFKGMAEVGVAAGASTPDWLIEEVVTKVKEIEDRTKEQEPGERTTEPGDRPRTDVVEAEQGETPGPDAGQATAAAADPAAADPAAADPAAVDPAAADPAAADLDPVADPAVEPAGEVAVAQGETGDEPAGDEEEEGFTGMESIRMLDPGDVVPGRVIEVRPGEGVMVDVGYATEGLVPLNELARRSVQDPLSLVKPGDEIMVQVLKLEGEEGTPILSKRKADEERTWGSMQAAFASGTPVEGKVTQAVKGGLLVDVGIRAFMPASHVGTEFVRDLNPYVGKQVTGKVIEIDRKERRVILSERSYLAERQQAKADEIWGNIAEGQVLTGTVKRLTDFGAFVDLGGVDGLLHISELSWGRVSHPREVVDEGEEIQVKVLRLDRERNRISLGKRQLDPDPWTQAAEKLQQGSIVAGKVVRLVPFGAFVQLSEGVDGLVHISQIAEHRISKPDEVLTVGQEVRVKVLAVNTDAKRISLSIREAEQDRGGGDYRSYMAQQPTGDVTVGEMLAARGGVAGSEHPLVGDPDEAQPEKQEQNVAEPGQDKLDAARPTPDEPGEPGEGEDDEDDKKDEDDKDEEERRDDKEPPA